MANLEDEVKLLKEQNKELVQKVQHWKMTAAQRENEKLELMKEINELRLKLSRIRSGGAAQLRQLDAALQSASQEALTHLVQASSAVARSMDLAKAYMRDRQELDASSPRWSSISGTPTAERVNRVPPLLIGGQSIQPVVSLSRTLFNSSTRSVNRSPNHQTRSATERAVPIHMLQDVYIPLTRIDAGETLINMETDTGSNEIENSTEDLSLEDSGDNVVDNSQNMSDVDGFENSRRLDAVTEDLEPDDDEETPPSITRARPESPLEGPSWLLDIQNSQSRSNKSRVNLEPDSTTELEENVRNASPLPMTSRLDCEFSPTVRRRKRTSSPRTPLAATTPHYSPRQSMSGRVLKVMVAKMRLDEDEEASPPKRASRGPPPSPGRSAEPALKLMRFDAPSPNGATDARVIVLETKSAPCGSGEPGAASDAARDTCDTRDVERDARDARDARDTRDAGDARDTRGTDAGNETRDTSRDTSTGGRPTRYDSGDSDSGSEKPEGRTRRPRKAVTYKEKPLNRKLRR